MLRLVTNNLPEIPEQIISPVVYYATYDTPISTARFSQLLQEIPGRFREKINRFRRWQDAHANLLGKLLLLHAFKEKHCNATLNDIVYTKYGRPYIINAPDFNISHSGQMVVCAISYNGRIGIDIERCVPISIGDFQKQFSPTEWNNIEQSSPQEPLFYRYWTIKEAILKADGRGISTSLDSLDVTDGATIHFNGQPWYVSSVDHFEHYICHIATDVHHQQYSVRKVSFS
ncbi:4'-phosphopantetheinyl transferase superfamily protein [Chitinophaga sp. 212800010-3]|uniref:4'-phosphopantetheinyl transferase family protein n=1 Tax=unclassified Chitinophaga TaxID=2619133 RepID=UPI002DE7DC52|nr:4'-phosphopantetheinyl transferase superfamily protein [Chitinophaga sp. 212800010-3]